MAKYTVNKAGVARCKELIDAHQYVLRSEWGRTQPDAEAKNKFLASHSWEEYAAWHLGLTERAGSMSTRWPSGGAGLCSNRQTRKST